MEKPQRKESGYRQYNGDAIDRLFFIQQAKELGFSLKEIAELLSIKSDASTVCSDVKHLAEDKLSDVEVFKKKTGFYIQRLEGNIPNEGVLDHEGCCIR